MKLIILLLFAAAPACAQLSDNFDDGDLLNGPVWIQNPSSFIIHENELRSTSQIPNHIFQIYTASAMVYGEWHFKVRLNFATSGTNYTDIFLLADATDFTASKGYFVRLGGTDDEISLFRKDASSEVKIIDGENGFVRANVNYSIKVVRTNDHRWVLFVDNGIDTKLMGLATDPVYNTSVAFGFRVSQSTASFFEKHFFDDVLLQSHIPDVAPPELLNVIALNASQLQLEFDEPVLFNGYLPALFYVEQIGFPTQVDVQNNNVILSFAQYFPEGENLRLTVNEVHDVWNNLASNLSLPFTYYVPQFGSVVIHEIFADPDPPMLMPQIEWIELRNTSQYPISLNGWKFCKPTGCSGSFPNIHLQPDSLLIITTSQDTSMHQYGRALKISAFPGLGNAGDEIWLESYDGSIIHTVSYSDEWYDNPLKKVGGWSLEMMDPTKPCSGKVNWRASEEHQGATPGQYNSVNGLITDEEQPVLKRVYMNDSLTIEMIFSKSMHTSTQTSNFQIQNSLIQIASSELVAPMHQKIILKLSQPVLSNRIYSLEVSGLMDCSGNRFQALTIPVAIAFAPLVGDIIINEILFNPTPAGTDYVELYNRSDRVIDLKHVYLANINTSGVTSNIAVVEPRGFAVFPKSFVVISKDSGIVQREYVYQNPECFIDMPNMPAYNDNEGKVVLMNQTGETLDEVEYKANWHFPLLGNVEGVSLERIHYQDFSNNKQLWHSASRSVGYGTPGYKNSQFQSGSASTSDVNFSTNIISPDNDGRDDFLNIEFTFLESGNLSNIYIFDIHGRVVRILHRNILNGTSGRWIWDGLGNQNKPLPTGRYVLLIEVFNANGMYQKFKKVITVIHPKT